MSSTTTQSILHTIGSTPLVKLSKIVPDGCADIYIKLEYFNPTGSYKDRMALAIVEEAEKRAQPDDYPRRPIDLAAAGDQLVHPRADRGRRKQWRGLGDAASTRSDAHIGDRWLWLHREQFYSVYFATLQAGLRKQR